MNTPEPEDGLPPICGGEAVIAEITSRPALLSEEGGIDFRNVRSAFAIALHMHQPLIPAGGSELTTAAVISNLQYMFEHPDVGDNHDAPVFLRCYERMGRFLPDLVAEGARPRIMLEYSGCLLHGLRLMGAHEVLERLREITVRPDLRSCVEWLGMPWGHPVAPSTPVQDYRLHVRAWQHHFAALFGREALSRVKGFSPSEMALPNHPDVAYEFVKTLRECGYEWVLVQEHTVERFSEGGPLANPHRPHRLVARNSRGEEASILAIVKTQGSDTKLVGQMQPYYEAKGLGRIEFEGRSFPPLVTQIADGENGGVMMNEFPGKYFEVMREVVNGETPAVNVSEYLAFLRSSGVSDDLHPAIQPVMQHRIWERFDPGAGPEGLARVLEELKAEDDRFHVEGGSWTNDKSWVRGYEHVLDAMQEASASFARVVLERGIPPTDPRYRNALFHLLTTQTSCYRYWGQGTWTDYGRELCRRTQAILTHDF